MDVSLWNNRTRQFPSLPQGGGEPPAPWAGPPDTVGGATLYYGQSHATLWAWMEPCHIVSVSVAVFGAEPHKIVGGATQHSGWGKGRRCTGLQVHLATQRDTDGPGTHSDCSLCKVEPNCKSTDEGWLLMETTDPMDAAWRDWERGYRPIGCLGLMIDRVTGQ